VQPDATCTSDTKLLNDGPTQVFGEGPETYWELIEGGLQSAFGNDEAAKIEYLSGVFGQQFTTLEEARDYNLQSLSAAFDKNQDGLVCVYDLRGTRANLRDPYSKYTYFSISDDKISKRSNDALHFRRAPGG
jgi:DNA phosphorothioation-dependent restriction protein DptG